jgi:DNA-binding transcriptional MerR regulator
LSDDEPPIYSIGAVERMIGIPAATMRNWEQRYGLITPQRSPGGHRLYTERQVEQLRFLKRELGRGLAPATAHRLLAEEAAPSEPVLRNGGADSPGRLILLAERDPYAAEFAAIFLASEGYEVVVAFDAPGAERAALERLPDLAIVEITISGGAGRDLCALLKAHGVPACLAVSALQAEAEALASGADAFVAKPLEPLRFVSTVKDLLARRATARGARARRA